MFVDGVERMKDYFIARAFLGKDARSVPLFFFGIVFSLQWVLITYTHVGRPVSYIFVMIWLWMISPPLWNVFCSFVANRIMAAKYPDPGRPKYKKNEFPGSPLTQEQRQQLVAHDLSLLRRMTAVLDLVETVKKEKLDLQKLYHCRDTVVDSAKHALFIINNDADLLTLYDQLVLVNHDGIKKDLSRLEQAIINRMWTPHSQKRRTAEIIDIKYKLK